MSFELRKGTWDSLVAIAEMTSPSALRDLLIACSHRRAAKIRRDVHHRENTVWSPRSAQRQ